MRRHNLSSTLRVIQRSAPVTRGDLIGSTGLSRVTVLDLVAELQTLQLIEETSPHNTGRGGRPARSLRMDSSVLAVGALEFNLGQVSFVWASLRGDSLGSLRVPIEVGHHDYDQMCSVAAALLHQAISSCSAEGRRLIHVTVGCLGVVNRSGGTVSSLALGWVDVPLAAELSRRTGADITYTVDPLAHLAVHAEREMGQWPDEEAVLMLYGDIGLGGSYQRRSDVLHGDSGSGAEFGHITVEFGGRPCYCGRRGCLATYVGVGPLANVLDGAPERDVNGPEIPLTETLAAVARAGPAVRTELASQGRWLARGVDILMAAFDPSVVVLGGALAKLAPMMMQSFEKEMQVLNVKHEPLAAEIRLSSIGDSAVLRGGITMAIRSIVSAPWLAAMPDANHQTLHR